LTIVDCSFCRVELRGTNLRGAELEDCDFRYARFFGATLQDTRIRGCDFYRAYFAEGTILAPRVLASSSFTRAWLAGILELRKQHVQHRRKDSMPPLAQELSPENYAKFLERTAHDRFERNPGQGNTIVRSRQRSDTLTETINARHDEAAVVYRRLAALWTSQGAYSYAGWAYVRGKRKERSHVSPFRAIYEAELKEDGKISIKEHDGLPGPEQSLWKWFVLLAADVFSAFGEGLGHVVGWLALLVLIPAGVYAATDGVQIGSGPNAPAADFWDSLLYSLTELVNAAPKRLQAAADAVETMSAIQTVTGVVLLALLGFVLGNKLHSA
jgi:hypothetical protein